MYNLFKPLLFRLDAEQAHDLAIRLLERASTCTVTQRALGASGTISAPELSQTLWGLRFPNPIGLAAGLDKNARAVGTLAALGFGFIEIGSVTPRAQAGNPRPRVFRLEADRAIINRMGFPNEGANAVAQRLQQLKARGGLPVPLGINLGKNKDTPLAEAARDYCTALAPLFPYGDYAVINVSSPNTPGLRLLQGADALRELLQAVQRENRRLATQHGRTPLPCLLKIAPDLAEEDLEAIAALAIETDLIDGLIATNTTLSRDGLSTTTAEAGGLSGAPLRARSTQVIRRLHHTLTTHPGAARRQVPIIGVGGVASGADALTKIRAGAHLIQLYTAFIYGGPRIAHTINTELRDELRRLGCDQLTKLVGIS